MTSLKKTMRAVLLLAAATLLLVGCGGEKKAPQQSADNYPKTNINGIIAWGAGGALDNITRAMAPLAEKNLGKSIILANKPGATGAISMQYVYDQKPDGYTVLFHAENPQLYKVLGLSKLDFADFDPVMIFGKGVGVLCVAKDSPYKTIDDLIAAAKANPGKVNMGSTGVGGLPHVSASFLTAKENLKVNFVNYDGEGPIVTALLGKQIEAAFIGVGAAAQYVKSGDLKGLAVLSNSKLDILGDVPALGQLKPAYQESLKTFGAFFGVYVKKGTPEDVTKKLIDSFEKAYKEDKFQQYMKGAGVVPVGITGKEAAQYVKTWQSQNAWLLHSVGGTKESPEKFGIPKVAQ